MKFFAHGPRGSESLAVSDGDRTYDLSGLELEGIELDGPGSPTALTRAFFEAGGIDRTRAAITDGELAELTESQDRRGAPLQPGKIVCIGLNYRDHAAETGAEIPSEPILFLKAPDTVVGPDDDVLIPRGSTRTDWEVELGVVIGSTLRYADSEEEAMTAVAGYVLCHDVSEREFQIERGGTWDKGKNCETFTPLGPWFVTADEIADPQDLSLRLSVNGEVRQDGTTADQIFSVAATVAYLSRFMTLYPGDIISTGTPAGVALGAQDVPYLREGDVVELSGQGLGTQRQHLRQA